MEDFDYKELNEYLDELLKNANDSLTQQNINDIEREKAERWNNGIQNGLAVTSGMLDVAGTASHAAQIKNDPYHNYQLNLIRGAGTHGYATYDQVLNEMRNYRMPKMVSADDIRGMTTGQKWGAVGKGALSGAATGATFGPWGAAIGGALGAAGAGIGVLSGDAKAGVQARLNNYETMFADAGASKNYNAAIENIAHNNAVQGIARSVGTGGQIERKSESIQDFANRVLGKKNSILPKRTLCKGGVMVKVKMK